MRFAYIHTYNTIDYGEWRVLEGLILHDREYGKHKATILYAEGLWMRVIDEHHIDHLISAAFWVYAHEFERLAKQIENDWERRHCWRKAYEDVQRIRKERGEAA